MELLSFLKTAAHITGNSSYAKEYRKVAMDLGYARLATRYKELREEINYSDEELEIGRLPLTLREIRVTRRNIERWRWIWGTPGSPRVTKNCAKRSTIPTKSWRCCLSIIFSGMKPTGTY